MKLLHNFLIFTLIFVQGCWGQQGGQPGNQPQPGQPSNPQQPGQQQQQQQPASGQQQGPQQPLLFIPNHNPVQAIFNPFLHFFSAGAHGVMEVGKNIFEFPLNVLRTGQVYITSALNSFASPQWVPPPTPDSPLLNLLNRLTSTTTSTTTTTTTPRPRPPG